MADQMSVAAPVWRRAWPASLCVVGVVLVIVGRMVARVVPGLRGTRVADEVAIWGMWGLALLGIPLLLAWALWSLTRVHHWAARVGIYLAVVLGVAGLCLWFFVAIGPPQM